MRSSAGDRPLRQRAVVLLDRLAEAFRHLIRSRQRQRLVAGLHLAAQRELELLQLVDRRGLQFLESLRVGVDAVVVELPDVLQDLVEIADNGPGVSAEMSGRVFEPFFTTKPVGEGTGLGLSVSLGIADAHGGSLTLVPSVKGACFRLTLPAAPGTRVETAALSARA